METELLEYDMSGKNLPIEEVISSLKFISKIKVGEKINVKGESITSDMLSRVFRFFSKETRKDTLVFLRGTYEKALNLLNHYCAKPSTLNDSIVKKIITDIYNANEGVANLIITYKVDRNFVTKLETLLDTVDIRLKSNGNLNNFLNKK